MLHKVELLVRCGCPKILTVISKIFGFLFTLIVSKTHRAFLTKRWISQHIIDADRTRCNKRIVRGNQAFAIYLADVMQKHIHQTQAARVSDNFITEKSLVLQEMLLVSI